MDGKVTNGKFSNNRGLVYGMLGAEGYVKLQNYSKITFKTKIESLL